MLTILQMKPHNMMLVTSNEEGIFSMTGLSFYDTATFSFKADKAKNYPYGKVEILAHELARMDFEASNYNLIVLSTPSPQRVISDYEVPKDSKLLKTVEVRASRIPEEFQNDYRVKRTYGAPDYVIKAKDLNTSYGNLIYALVGKVPGLVVQPDAGYIGFSRAAAQSITFGSGPMVTINDVPMGGNAFDIISNINPLSVESIEFTKRLNVLYGSQGASGVISIYTKQGVSEDALRATPNFQTIKLMGYSSSRSFKFPNYEDKETDATKGDYRSTIYWNPNVSTNITRAATISFFAAGLPGKYRIVVEGISQSGEPIRCVNYIEVSKD